MKSSEYQAVLEHLREIWQEESRWEKNDDRVIRAIAWWIKPKPAHERRLIYNAIVEAVRSGEADEWLTWSVPELLSRLNDTELVMMVWNALPDVRQATMGQQTPTIYEVMLIYLLDFASHIPDLITTYLRRVDELISAGESYGVHMLWRLWLRNPDTYAPLVLPRFRYLFTELPTNIRCRLLEYWISTLYVSSEPARLSLLIDRLAEAGVSKSTVRETVLDCVRRSPMPSERRDALVDFFSGIEKGYV